MTLYDTDFVFWTQQQTDILRSMPVESGIDIDFLVGEIDGLGRTALADLSSALIHVLRGLIRRSLDPASVSVEEILSAQSEAIIRSDAGVWRHVDVDKVWRLAKRPFDAVLPERCPITIEQLISEDFDAEESVTALKL